MSEELTAKYSLVFLIAFSDKLWVSTEFPKMLSERFEIHLNNESIKTYFILKKRSCNLFYLERIKYHEELKNLLLDFWRLAYACHSLKCSIMLKIC